MTAIKDNKSGFSLVELLVAMAIASIVMTLIYGMYVAQVKTHTNQKLIAEMQQNVRSAMNLIERTARMAGYDSTGDADAGIKKNFTSFGSPHDDLDIKTDATHIAFTVDFDGNGVIDLNGDELLAYRLNNSNLEVWKEDPKNPGNWGWRILAENIEAVGFAFAFDDDADGQLDNIGGHVIWAYDSDNNGDLDREMDTNGDGLIDTADDPVGVPLASAVNFSSIRAVRIWLLGRTGAPLRGQTDNQAYKVGLDTISGDGDGFKRQLLISTVQCRNLGL